MRKTVIIFLIVSLVTMVIVSFRGNNSKDIYRSGYMTYLGQFMKKEQQLLHVITNNDVHTTIGIDNIRAAINETRDELKKMDFWFRYLEPTVYKRINGPLPVEWETEVFEKFEKPYKREGAGLTLAALYLEEEAIEKDSLLHLVQAALDASQVYAADSITKNLEKPDHFYLCNRLFLLNLATIYTTGFECPDTSRIIPELRLLMSEAISIYRSFNESFSTKPLNPAYLSLYRSAIDFVNSQPDHYSEFDHFIFIRDFINPLFSLNQQMIREYRIMSGSFVDYSLSKTATSIFDKRLYDGLNPKGIFLRVENEKELQEIEKVGKMLFYDPILSGNNKRSCASCHKPEEYFTDTIVTSASRFDQKDLLPRNTPSLVNVVYNHLAMLDGKHISLQDQLKDVIVNPLEMGGNEKEIIQKVLSCADYKKSFKELAKLTPWEPEVTFDHIVSAVSFYYSKFSRYYSPFDEAMSNTKATLSVDAQKGFNLFMSKAQCATCHFAPQFNGVKPPFIGSEFEVLGVPADTSFTQLSGDKGRFGINPAEETLHAFRTGSLRNSMRTAPYMHNGVFKTMKEVINFYDAGGGAGRGLAVSNQTLSSDSLGLSGEEKESIIVFLNTLTEKIPSEAAPEKLPRSMNKQLNGRKAGGEY